MSKWEKVEQTVGEKKASPSTSKAETTAAVKSTAAETKSANVPPVSKKSAMETKPSKETIQEAESVKRSTRNYRAADDKYPPKPSVPPVEAESKEENTDYTEESPIIRSSRRYNKAGRRKGHYRFAAPLGLLVLLLALTGVVALVQTGIQSIIKSQDDTELRTELEDFLMPVMQYNPTAFTDVNESKQDALILSAIWRVTEAERIRQLQQKDDTSIYTMDDLGRLLIPVSEINTSYTILFGDTAVPYHHSIGDEGQSFSFEYSEADQLYHVPYSTSSSLYQPVLDTLKEKDDQIAVRVGYVLKSAIAINDKGEDIAPTPDMADSFQVYTVEKTAIGWKLIAVADEK